MKLKVYTADGSSSQEKDFPGIPSFEGGTGQQAVKDVVTAMRANARQGDANTKTRGEVSGGGKKPWRQKGTGNARAGSRRSPIWVGGGTVFGPRTRDYSKKVNRRVKSLALRRAFYDLASGGGLHVIEEFRVSPAKTKVLAGTLDRIVPKGRLLLVDDSFTDETVMGGRNIARAQFQEADTLNTYDLALYQNILISEKALERLLKRINGGNES